MSSTYKHTLERNARLDVLHSRGLINVTNSDALNVSHNTIANVFDRDNTNTSMIVLDNNEDPAFTEIAIVGEENAPLANRLDMFVGVVLAGNIVINKGDVDEFTVDYVVPNRTSFYTFQTRVDIPFPRTVRVKKITINYTSFDPDENATSNDVRLYGVDLYRNVHKSDLIEFDDAVLETKGWNSSRYSGRQLQGSKINEFNEGDNSYAGTPVVQNYSRNIYLGSRVIGMESGSIEDASLLNLPGFSYITVHEYITVNDDLSVTKNTIRGDIGERVVKKKGFYQSWYKDFPNQSKIEVKTLDRKLQQSLRPNYTIFNNSGQLQKLLLVHKAPDPAGFHHVALYNRDSSPSTDPEDNAFSFATGSYLTLGSNFFFFNKSLLVDEFFTGSLIAEDIIGTTVANQGSNPEEGASDFGG